MSRGGAIAVERWETGAEVVVEVVDAKEGAELAQWTAMMPVPSSTAGKMGQLLGFFLRLAELRDAEESEEEANKREKLNSLV